jgi:F420H(2)-dependent quinone reductase
VSLKVRTLSSVHRVLYSASGGRVGRRIVGMPVLLLTTVGRSSGRRRTVPLTYFEDGEALVVVASFGGRPHNPAWFENLVANADVEVQIGRGVERRRARRATAEERARLWPRIVAAYGGYEKYQTKTDREIPLAVLH